MAKAAEKTKVDPLRPSDFGLIEHTVRRFNAVVPGNSSKDELEDINLWVNVASKLEMGSEIRCIADDMSFIATGICTYAMGSTAKIKIIQMHDLDEVDQDALNEISGDYEAQLRGSKKWCIVQKSTGDIIKDSIATQLECMRELEDYKKALRA